MNSVLKYSVFILFLKSHWITGQSWFSGDCSMFV